MIESPLRGLIIKTCAGFLVNVHLLITLAIIFEKVRLLILNQSFQLTEDLSSYTASIIPLITIASLTLFTCLFSLVILTKDLFEKGCLAWHRDSIGLLVQKIIFSICFLCTSIYLYNYIYHYEYEGNNCKYFNLSLNYSIQNLTTVVYLVALFPW